MGSCCSAPVSDQQQPHHGRGSVDSQQDADEGGRHGHRKSSAQVGGQHKAGQHGSAKAGRRASIDWNQPILDHFEDVKEKYAFDKVLGKGQFGVTRLVVDTATEETCACKSISKRKLVSLEDMEDVRREIKVMHHLSGHPNVVAFKGGKSEHRLGGKESRQAAQSSTAAACTVCAHRRQAIDSLVMHRGDLEAAVVVCSAPQPMRTATTYTL